MNLYFSFLKQSLIDKINAENSLILPVQLVIYSVLSMQTSGYLVLQKLPLKWS